MEPFEDSRATLEGLHSDVTHWYERWVGLAGLNNPQPSPRRRREQLEALDDANSELSSGMRRLDWALQELEENTSLVEQNNKKFKLSEAELRSRWAYLQRTRGTVDALKVDIAEKQRAMGDERDGGEGGSGDEWGDDDDDETYGLTTGTATPSKTREPANGGRRCCGLWRLLLRCCCCGKQAVEYSAVKQQSPGRTLSWGGELGPGDR